MTVIGLVEPVPVKLPGLDVTVYPVMAVPPLVPGAVKGTEACALPAVAVPIVGAPGAIEATVKVCCTCVAAKFELSPA